MSNAPGEKIDPSRLAPVSLYVLERISELAANMRTTLRGIGITGARTFGTQDDLEQALRSAPPDVLILSEHTDTNIFDTTKKVRRSIIGRNPFTIVLLLVSPDKQESIEAAVKSGADAALVKPVTSAQLINRIFLLAANRSPFIATTDYIGPERRASSGRVSDIPLVQTVNTLRYKLERKTIPTETLDKAIAITSAQLWMSQLKSYGLKLRWLEKRVVGDTATQVPAGTVNVGLSDLATAFEEAAVIAQRIPQPGILKTCKDLAEELKGLATNGDGSDDQKVTRVSTSLTTFEQMLKKLEPSSTS